MDFNNWYSVRINVVLADSLDIARRLRQRMFRMLDLFPSSELAGLGESLLWLAS